MLTVFTGYDTREAFGTWVWQHSVLKRISCPVSFTVLDKRTMSSYSQLYQLGGSNQFIYSRFAAADIAHYSGPPVIFADGADMVCTVDLKTILDEAQYGMAVQVVKRPDYQPTPVKYLGTEMESANRAYHCKQWSSVMLIQPSHCGWRRINWEMKDPAYWQEFGWLRDNEIGELDPTWNRLVDEGDPVDDAKIMHFTLGIPAMRAYRSSPGAEKWWVEAKEALEVCDSVWHEKRQTFLV